MLLSNALGYSVFEENVDFVYDIQTTVELIPDVSADDFETITQWGFNGTLRVQRIDHDNVAIQVVVGSLILLSIA